MRLHELAANAAKHGAFTRKRGTLGVRWQKVAPEKNGALHLKWQEFGGSYNVQRQRSGYGFTLIDATTKSLDAKVERHFLGEELELVPAMNADDIRKGLKTAMQAM